MATINYSEALKVENKIFIDVRSPSEFAKDHIDGAVNIPLFSDEQRAIVGTIYKKDGQQPAIDIGVKFFSERLPQIVSELREYDGKKIIAYCWRGGMRSGSFVSFLGSLNFDIVQLDGGYKTFRGCIREELYNFDMKPKIFCIFGMTGTAKTDIIKILHPMSIDLEGIAGHRSSIFGHVGLEPRLQKMFESILLSELRRVDEMSHMFFEGESRRIGNINIPDSVFKKMMAAVPIRVVSDLSFRVKRIVGDYFDSAEKIREVDDVLDSHLLKHKLGAKNVDFMKECLKESRFEELVEVLLTKYYDPMYQHSQKRLSGCVEISVDDLDDAVQKIQDYATS
ncbi:tRNA 2-selenouridine(34) synthase MnmH [Thermodesulfobacteriota bacterium]